MKPSLSLLTLSLLLFLQLPELRTEVKNLNISPGSEHTVGLKPIGEGGESHPQSQQRHQWSA
jgi:hypothetical protein